MRICWLFGSKLIALLLAPAAVLQLPAQTATSQPTAPGNQQLQFVVYLSRHGVRSPTGKAAQYNQYSAAPWPEWSVQPGYLTAHGYKLMTLFGAYDRARLAADGLFAPAGCADAARVTILADSDQRTRETGKAIAEGMFPGCASEVHALPEGTNDPLFHPLHSGIESADKALALAAISGRIGGDAKNLTQAYRPQLEILDGLLAGCRPAAATQARTLLFDVPVSLAAGSGDHLTTLRGPITVASTLSENLLLEYTEGMHGQDLGWGCLDAAKLRAILQLHTAAADFSERTAPIARIYAANLLKTIATALAQSTAGKAVSGAPGKSGDRMLFLAGHDTNIAAVAGSLGLTWIIDGRRDDTPPGGALIFELWRSPANIFSIRVFYTAQTLDQMRDTQTLSAENPPARAEVYVPGCSGEDGSCTLQQFAAIVDRAVNSDRPTLQP